MMKVLIHGSSGAMGRTLKSIIEEDDALEYYGFDHKPSDQKNIYNNYDSIPQVDIVIDFSHYKATDQLLEFALKRKLPLVIGTTGLEEDSQIKIYKASKDIPIFQSNNMSFGIYALLEMTRLGSNLLKDFDIEIIEKHHTQKIDAPSGTAQLIFNTLKEENSALTPIYGRHGKDENHHKNQVGIHALRGGNIIGEHTTIFAGLDEVIEIKHTATSKRTFALGAIEAAKYIYRQPLGLYNMSHIARKEKK